MAATHLRHFADRIIRSLARKAHKGAPAEQAEQEDYGYEATLLDLEIRSFLHSEYIEEEPSLDVFRRLISTIQRHEVARSRYDSRPHVRQAVARCLTAVSHTFVTLSRAATRTDVPRVISGGLVTMLVVTAMWPRMMSVLNGSSLVNYDANSLPLATEVEPARYRNSLASSREPSQQAIEQAMQEPAVRPGSTAPGMVPQPISPGLIYEQRRLWVERHLGEDLGASGSSVSSSKPSAEEATNRKKAKSQSKQDKEQVCVPNKPCAK